MAGLAGMAAATVTPNSRSMSSARRSLRSSWLRATAYPAPRRRPPTNPRPMFLLVFGDTGDDGSAADSIGTIRRAWVEDPEGSRPGRPAA